MGPLIAVAVLCGVVTHSSWVTTAMFVVGSPVAYGMACWWFPFGWCWCCKRTGRHASKSGKTFRDCKWCKGSGRRLRIGRRIYNHYAKARRKAS